MTSIQGSTKNTDKTPAGDLFHCLDFRFYLDFLAQWSLSTTVILLVPEFWRK
jgi:hypothetical protein